ncbi:MAG: DUF6285 domain-containing protein [Vulcanimicrobiota bacterium]
MLPSPDALTILQAVSTALDGTARESQDPALSFKLRLTAGLVSMVGRELAHPGDEAARLSEFFQSDAPVEALRERLLEAIEQAEPESPEWQRLTAYVKTDLAHQLKVIQPRFDTSGEPA